MLTNHIILDAKGSEENGIQLLKKLNLEFINEIVIDFKPGFGAGVVNLTLVFADGDTALITNAFKISPSSKDSSDLYNILTKSFKISEGETEKLFN